VKETYLKFQQIGIWCMLSSTNYNKNHCTSSWTISYLCFTLHYDDVLKEIMNSSFNLSFFKICSPNFQPHDDQYWDSPWVINWSSSWFTFNLLRLNELFTWMLPSILGKPCTTHKVTITISWSHILNSFLAIIMSRDLDSPCDLNHNWK
jgi:hypothetical protein